MLSFAKNDRGVRMASAAILFLPLAAMICATSHSEMVNMFVAFGWLVFAALSFICCMFGNAEDEERRR